MSSLPPSEIYRQAKKFRSALLHRERQASTQIVRKYGEVWLKINQEIQRVVGEYYKAAKAGEDVTTWLYQMQRLDILRSQVEREMSVFAQYADELIQKQQRLAIEAGSAQAVELLDAAAPGIGAQFHRLPEEALIRMIGFQQDGSPLLSILRRYGQEAGEAVANGLIQGLALGWGPARTARLIRKDFGNSLWQSLRLARTETLRAYRAASLETYRMNDDLVEGWVWVSARNERTCAACWAMDGTLHSLDEELDDHPNGRCTAIPKVVGVELPMRETGVEAFSQLSEVEQLKVLGPAKYAAWKDGQFTLPDLVGQRWDAQWGSMRYEKSLRELGIDWRQYAGVSLPSLSQSDAGLLAIAQSAAPEMQAIVNTPQNWRGVINRVSIKDSPYALGWFDPTDNSITIREDARDNTIIHELLHGHSVGVDVPLYRKLRGWEEGVIEKLQRLIGPEILEKIGRTPIMGTSSYNYFVNPLQKLAAKSKLSERDFFLRLIRTPLKDRPGEAIVILKEAGYTEERAVRMVTRYRKFLER